MDEIKYEIELIIYRLREADPQKQELIDALQDAVDLIEQEEWMVRES